VSIAALLAVVIVACLTIVRQLGDSAIIRLVTDCRVRPGVEAEGNTMSMTTQVAAAVSARDAGSRDRLLSAQAAARS
jgi:hypothetical protein